MTKKSIISICAALIGSFVLHQSATAQWPRTTDHNPWSVEIGAKALDRPGDKLGIPLITDTSTSATLFDSSQASDLGTATAAEVKFNFRPRNGNEYEIRSIIAHWDEDTTIDGPNIASPLFPPAAAGNTYDAFRYNFESDYFSIEAMQRRTVLPGLVWMFGPRFVSTKELMKTATDVTTTPVGGGAQVAVTAESEIEATNFLVGLQTGFEINRPIIDGIYTSGFVRVGGYYNPTEVGYADRDSVLNVTVSESRDKGTTAFLGEVGGRLYWDIIPNCFQSYAGYEATWMDGVTQAAPQKFQDVFSSDRSVDTSNTIFFHGVTFGLRMTY